MNNRIANIIQTRTGKMLATVAVLITLLAFAFPAYVSAQGTSCSSIDVQNSGDTISFNYWCYFPVPKGWWDVIPEYDATYESRRVPYVASTEQSRSAARQGWTTDGCSGPEIDNTPITNGLGIFLPSNSGLVTPNDLFEAACVEHDYCYATHGATKQTCDLNFLNNMNYICRIANNGIGCYDVTSIMFTAVVAAPDAQNAYDNAQNFARNNR